MHGTIFKEVVAARRAGNTVGFAFISAILASRASRRLETCRARNCHKVTLRVPRNAVNGLASEGMARISPILRLPRIDQGIAWTDRVRTGSTGRQDARTAATFLSPTTHAFPMAAAVWVSRVSAILASRFRKPVAIPVRRGKFGTLPAPNDASMQ